MRSRFGYITADKLIWINVDHERAQRLEMLVPGSRLIILFDKWDGHESVIVNGKRLIDQTLLPFAICTRTIYVCLECPERFYRWLRCRRLRDLIKSSCLPSIVLGP